MIGQQNDDKPKNVVFLDWDGTMDHSVPQIEKKKFWQKSFETLERLLSDPNVDVYILTANAPLQIAVIIETALNKHFDGNEFPNLRSWINSDKVVKFKGFSEKIRSFDEALIKIRDPSFKVLEKSDESLFQEGLVEINSRKQDIQSISPAQIISLDIAQDNITNVQVPETKEKQSQFIENILYKIRNYKSEEGRDNPGQLKDAQRQMIIDLFKIDNMTVENQNQLNQILEADSIEESILHIAKLKGLNGQQDTYDICLDASRKMLGNIKAVATNFYNQRPNDLMSTLQIEERDENRNEQVLPIDDSNRLGFYSGIHQKKFAIQDYLSKNQGRVNIFFADDSPENVADVQMYVADKGNFGIFITVPQYDKPHVMAHFDFFQSLSNLSKEEMENYKKCNEQDFIEFYASKNEILSFLSEAERRLKEDIKKIENLNNQPRGILSLFAHKKGAQDPLLMRLTEYHTSLLKAKEAIDRDLGPNSSKMIQNISSLINEAHFMAQDKVVQNAPIEKRKISEGFLQWIGEKLGVLKVKTLALSEIQGQEKGMRALSKESDQIVNDAQKVLALDKKIAEKEKILLGEQGYYELKYLLMEAKYLSDGSKLYKFKEEFGAGGLGNINIQKLDNQNGEAAIASVLQSYREGSKLLGKNNFLDEIKIKLSDKPDEFKSIKTAFENYEHRLNFKKTKVDPLIQQRAALMEKPGVKAAVEAARKAERSVTKPKKP